MTNIKKTVITTINSPTFGVKNFLLFSDVIVVGDEKTPDNWKCAGAEFIPIKTQTSKFGKILPRNHYSRKMIGYLEAIKGGADVIIDTDDDNIPYGDWGFPDFNGVFDIVYGQYNEFVNAYSYFTDQFIWPRGYPLHLINEKKNIQEGSGVINVGVWQGLADREPDVDAVYRMLINKECYFKKRKPIVLGNSVCPFNSQNTAFRKDVFPLLYIPTTVSMRFSDILRGLVAQPIMRLHGYHLGFTRATVYQDRNKHNIKKDFNEELFMYKHSEEICNLVHDVIYDDFSIEENLMSAYLQLKKSGITGDETKTLTEWLKSL